MTRSDHLRIAVALDAAGWHPAAWREPDARANELFSARYWVDLAQVAERGIVDFITIEDSFSPTPLRRGELDPRTDQVRGRLDAVLIAARVAPLTSSIGLVAVATTTHTEPFHVSKAIATLDFISQGRAGWQARISATDLEARLFGRRHGIEADGSATDTSMADYFEEAADFVEVVRRLWDSWEDNAEIRDASSGRFIDRDRLHYIDFAGRWFSVRGPSITPRPPQGQPVVSVLAHVPAAFALAAKNADLIFTTPASGDDALALVEEVRAHESAAGRAGEPLVIFADLVVFLDQDAGRARARKDRLDEYLGHPLRSDASVFVGTPDDLVERLLEWREAGLAGFRLRPGTIPHDFAAITSELIPRLQERGAFPRTDESASLRSRLGLRRPINRYAMT